MKGVDPRQISNQFGNLTSLNKVIAERRKKRQKDLELRRQNQREALIEKEQSLKKKLEQTSILVSNLPTESSQKSKLIETLKTNYAGLARMVDLGQDSTTQNAKILLEFSTHD